MRTGQMFERMTCPDVVEVLGGHTCILNGAGSDLQAARTAGKRGLLIDLHAVRIPTLLAHSSDEVSTSTADVKKPARPVKHWLLGALPVTEQLFCFQLPPTGHRCVTVSVIVIWIERSQFLVGRHRIYELQPANAAAHNPILP